MVAGHLVLRSAPGIAMLLGAIARGEMFSRGQLNGAHTRRYFAQRFGFPNLLSSVAPDVVLVHSMTAMPLAHLVSKARIPLVVYWHDVEEKRLHGSPEGLIARHVANSSFTAAFLKSKFNLDATVIPPIFVSMAHVQRDRDPAGSVLFVNPVKEKGLTTALDLARACPDIPFEFLESWTMPRQEWAKVEAAVAPLSNVRLSRRQSNMSSVYQRTKVLLVPSVWQEAWGRVVSEAQGWGIPALATRIGGLPESVGDGGVLVEPGASLSEWIGPLKRLYYDESYYDVLSRAADLSAARAELNPASNLSRLRSILTMSRP